MRIYLCVYVYNYICINPSFNSSTIRLPSMQVSATHALSSHLPMHIYEITYSDMSAPPTYLNCTSISQTINQIIYLSIHPLSNYLISFHLPYCI